MNKPNVVLLFVDDLGYGDVSCLNPESKIHTKNLDQLASEGITFTNAHATSSLCTPSRYGLLTGRYNWRSNLKRGAHHNNEKCMIEEGRMTLATLFRQQGYNTACIGKWHLGVDWQGFTPNPNEKAESKEIPDFTLPFTRGPLTSGFDYFYGIWGSLCQTPHVFLENDRVVKIPDTVYGDYDVFDYHLTDLSRYGVLRGPADSDYTPQACCSRLQEKVLEKIDEYCAEDKPFFLYYPTPAVHIPILPDEEFIGKSGIGKYGDFVLQVDHYIGQIMEKLEEKGIADNTIFIVTSDNGCAPHADYADLVSQGHNPSYIFRGRKGDIWEGGHRIPYVIRWPEKIKAGLKTDQLVSLADIMRTMADYFGVELPDEAAEDSFTNLPLWEGEDVPVREDLVSSTIMGCLCIQAGDWKLEMCPTSGGDETIGKAEELAKMSPQYQLYNMRCDYTERNNLFDYQPQIAEELKARLTKCIRDGRSTPGTPQKNTGGIRHDYWNEISWILD